MLAEEKQTSQHWVRLCGAISVMMLLGVPWIFSAFGAIDTSQNAKLADMELAFQVETRLHFGYSNRMRSNWFYIPACCISEAPTVF